MESHPYLETVKCPRVSEREFSSMDRDEFVWHRDREDRLVSSESDWLVQLDDRLPVPLKKPVLIPEGVYHRVIPGADERAVIRIVRI